MIVGRTVFLKAVKGHQFKLGGTRPHTIESFNNLLGLVEEPG